MQKKNIFTQFKQDLKWKKLKKPICNFCRKKFNQQQNPMNLCRQCNSITICEQCISKVKQKDKAKTILCDHCIIDVNVDDIGMDQQMKQLSDLLRQRQKQTEQKFTRQAQFLKYNLLNIRKQNQEKQHQLNSLKQQLIKHEKDIQEMKKKYEEQIKKQKIENTKNKEKIKQLSNDLQTIRQQKAELFSLINNLQKQKERMQKERQEEEQKSYNERSQLFRLQQKQLELDANQIAYKNQIKLMKNQMKQLNNQLEQIKISYNEYQLGVEHQNSYNYQYLIDFANKRFKSEKRYHQYQEITEKKPSKQSSKLQKMEKPIISHSPIKQQQNLPVKQQNPFISKQIKVQNPSPNPNISSSNNNVSESIHSSEQSYNPNNQNIPMIQQNLNITVVKNQFRPQQRDVNKKEEQSVISNLLEEMTKNKNPKSKGHTQMQKQQKNSNNTNKIKRNQKIQQSHKRQNKITKNSGMTQKSGEIQSNPKSVHDTSLPQKQRQYKQYDYQGYQGYQDQLLDDHLYNYPPNYPSNYPPNISPYQYSNPPAQRPNMHYYNEGQYSSNQFYKKIDQKKKQYYQNHKLRAEVENDPVVRTLKQIDTGHCLQPVQYYLITNIQKKKSSAQSKLVLIIKIRRNEESKYKNLEYQLFTYTLQTIQKVEIKNLGLERMISIGEIINLKHLDLGFNNLKTVKPIQSNIKIQRLYINNNILDTLDGLSALQELKQLGLQQNRLKKQSYLYLVKSPLSKLTKIAMGSSYFLKEQNDSALQIFLGKNYFPSCEQVYIKHEYFSKFSNIMNIFNQKFRNGLKNLILCQLK